MKFFRIGGALVGLWLVGYLLHHVGWTSVKETLSWLQWKYLIVLAYPTTWIFLNTVGWWFCFQRSPVGLSLFTLAQIRTAGETFNSLLPSGYVGGEPLKAKLLSKWLSLREATSSVLIAKAAQSIGLVMFLGLGLTLANPSGGSPLKKPATLVSMSLLTLGIGLFVMLLANRSFSRIGLRLHQLTGHPWLQAQEQRLLALDETLGSFYREGKNRFLISVFIQGAGWLAGALEVAMIFYLLGYPIGWRQAWFIGAMAQLAAVIGLFIPAGLGLYEGGHYMATALLGLPPSLGLSISLIRRIREVFWDGMGLAFFWRLSATGSVQSSVRRGK